MKRKTLRVRSEGSIPPYVTEAESRKQHSDSPLCNSLLMIVTTGSLFPRGYFLLATEETKNLHVGENHVLGRIV